MKRIVQFIGGMATSVLVACSTPAAPKYYLYENTSATSGAATIGITNLEAGGPFESLDACNSALQQHESHDANSQVSDKIKLQVTYSCK